MLTLLPQPRTLTLAGDAFGLPPQALIALEAPEPQRLRFTAERLQAGLRQQHGVHWEPAAGLDLPPEQVALTLRLRPEIGGRPQGYSLRVGPGGISITASGAAGLFYGAATLLQISAQSGPALPGLHIEDWPDFAARGVMLDISRDKVPTVETVCALVDQLAGWKINQFQLYTEHTFAYRRHAEVWAQASPFTAAEVLALDAYCRERFVELVPNQNSFGHLHRWLAHPRYQPLAEVTDGFDTPWGLRLPGSFSLCPGDPGSLGLLREWYDELLPNFTSRQFNVGCDETVDLGQGRSRAAVAERGAGRVYLDFLRQIHAEVRARGRVMQFWGDVILQHPELVPELPREAIALEWGYEADHPFDEHGARFAAAGLAFYVCPGTSAWNSLAGRTGNALANLRRAAESGRRHGAAGVLITDWGDNGHWQPRPVSDLGFAAGAAYAWAGEANHGLDVAAALNVHAYADPSGALGRAAHDLGEVYRLVEPVPANGSALFHALQTPWDQLPAVPEPVLARAAAAVDSAAAPLAGARSARPDGALLRREFELAARLLRHAVARLRLKNGRGQASALAQDLRELLGEYRVLWLARNRPGGLADSAARLERLAGDYAGR